MKCSALQLVFERLSDFSVEVIEQIGTEEPSEEDAKAFAEYQLRQELSSLLEGFLFELQMIAEGKNKLEDKRFSELDVAALRALAPVTIEVP